MRDLSSTRLPIVLAFGDEPDVHGGESMTKRTAPLDELRRIDSAIFVAIAGSDGSKLLRSIDQVASRNFGIEPWRVGIAEAVIEPWRVPVPFSALSLKPPEGPG